MQRIHWYLPLPTTTWQMFMCLFLIFYSFLHIHQLTVSPCTTSPANLCNVCRGTWLKGTAIKVIVKWHWMLTGGDREADQTWRHNAEYRQWVRRCIDSTTTAAESHQSDEHETTCTCELSLVLHNMMSHDPTEHKDKINTADSATKTMLIKLTFWQTFTSVVVSEPKSLVECNIQDQMHIHYRFPLLFSYSLHRSVTIYCRG